MHSGTAMRTSRWFENINKEFSYKLARKFSNDTHDPEEIISQLQAVPANDFIKEQFSVVSDDVTNYILSFFFSRKLNFLI